MRIWFPVVRTRSGSDVYVERLASALSKHGIEACLQWFDHRFELQPSLLSRVKPPAGTDLIHANSWNGFAFDRSGLPLVITAFHCVYRNGYPAWKSKLQSIYHDYWIGNFERRSFASADAVVAMAPSAVQDFSTRFRMPGVTVIHGWVDTNLFTPLQTSAVRDSSVRILIVGNSSKRKGMDLLPVLRHKLDMRFSITVVGGLRADWVQGCPGVIFKSGLKQLDLIKEYQDANLIISLSRYEGFGYTILEAMACAKPVVAFDVPGIRDLVEQSVTGFLCDPEDVTDMVNMCERIGDDDDFAKTMGRAARERTLLHFGEAHAVAKYIDLYFALTR